MPHLTNWFSVLENCTVGISSDMLHPPAPSGQTETKPAMSKTPPVIPTVTETTPPPHVYVCSADLHQCTKVPLKIHSVDTGTVNTQVQTYAQIPIYAQIPAMSSYLLYSSLMFCCSQAPCSAMISITPVLGRDTNYFHKPSNISEGSNEVAAFDLLAQVS